MRVSIPAAMAAILVWAMACGVPTGSARRACRASGPQDALPSDEALQQRMTAALERLADGGATARLAALETAVPAAAPFDLPSGTVPVRDLVELAARAQEAVVAVLLLYSCADCNERHVAPSSGFFVTSSGVCVTAAHVLTGEPADAVAVATTDGRVHPVLAVLARDQALDVAVLQVEGEGFACLPLAEPARAGAPAYVISHPESHYWVLTAGIVARAPATDAQGPELLVTAEYGNGSSGGPVLDAHGGAIGMVQGTRSVFATEAEGELLDPQMVLRYCVPAAAVRRVLASAVVR